MAGQSLAHLPLQQVGGRLDLLKISIVVRGESEAGCVLIVMFELLKLDESRGVTQRLNFGDA